MIRKQPIVFAAIVLVVAGSVIATGLAMRGRPAARAVAIAAASSESDSQTTMNEDGAHIADICRQVGAPILPAEDQLSPDQAGTLKDCDAEALYYGEGMKPDYIKARQCALMEDQRGDDNPFSGKTILMQIYANGLGTERNLDLATAIACTDQSHFVARGGRVLRIQDLATKPEPFDACDDSVTTYEINYCAARDSRIADFKRDSQIAAITRRLPTASAPLLAKMRTAFDAYVEAHIFGELDQTGTIRGIMDIDERNGERDQFLTDLTSLADGSWPAAGRTDATEADLAFNRSYQTGLKVCGDTENNDTTVRPDDVRAAQRAWLVYRDAYVQFAKIAAPAVTEDAIVTRLTRLRLAELHDLPCAG